MTMISYAQNFEDVMLWRCFKHLDNGFYIDVGANDPVIHSISLAFYQRGWRGVHIEPTLQYSSLLRQLRPDEQVIQVALGEHNSEIIFYEIPTTGLSTTHRDIARSHSEKRGLEFIETKVKQLTLDEILNHIHQEIHWLKIDVEGAEKQVLAGWQDSKLRPWVIVIESTLPMTRQESFQEWESLILNKGYEYVYFDGLNRFYISNEHIELKQHFNCPPNIFDDFIINELVLTRQDVEEKEQQIKSLQYALEQSHSETYKVRNEIDKMLSSTSWRITAPLRKTKSLFTIQYIFTAIRNIYRTIRSWFILRIKSILRTGVLFINRHLFIRNLCVKTINKLGLYSIAKSFYYRLNPITTVQNEIISNDELSVRANKIYSVLEFSLPNPKDKL